MGELRADDTKTWISRIWETLHEFREVQIPEGFVDHDQEWDEICTAMAWITEALERQRDDIEP